MDIASIILLVVFVVAITISGFAMGIQVPGPAGEVNPQTVAQEAPLPRPGCVNWRRANMRRISWPRSGVLTQRDHRPGWLEVTFYVTSKDVQHGFKYRWHQRQYADRAGPGVQAQPPLRHAGRVSLICHEYCGTGHAAMYGKVIVTP